MNIKRQSEKLYNLLGILPPKDAKVSCKTVSVEERENYIVERLVLHIDENPTGEEIPAYFIKPMLAMCFFIVNKKTREEQERKFWCYEFIASKRTTSFYTTGIFTPFINLCYHFFEILIGKTPCDFVSA